jgi:hypothetical protein
MFFRVLVFDSKIFFFPFLLKAIYNVITNFRNFRDHPTVLRSRRDTDTGIHFKILQIQSPPNKFSEETWLKIIYVRIRIRTYSKVRSGQKSSGSATLLRNTFLLFRADYFA